MKSFQPEDLRSREDLSSNTSFQPLRAKGLGPLSLLRVLSKGIARLRIWVASSDLPIQRGVRLQTVLRAKVADQPRDLSLWVFHKTQSYVTKRMLLNSERSLLMSQISSCAMYKLTPKTADPRKRHSLILTKKFLILFYCLFSAVMWDSVRPWSLTSNWMKPKPHLHLLLKSHSIRFSLIWFRESSTESLITQPEANFTCQEC